MEQELFGYDHSIVGALMAEDWGFPDYLVQAIGGHHGENGSPPVDPAVRLVSLVKYSTEQDGREELGQAATHQYGIEAALIEELVDRSFAEAQEVAGMFLE
jgi:HD-like signal output (HDOD) protein